MTTNPALPPEFGSASDRLPAPLVEWAARVYHSSVGSFLLRTWRALLDVEVFDRAMSIAAQFFTSLIPLSIAVGAAFGRDWQLGATLELPPEAAEVIEDAVTGTGTSTGIVGLVLILVLATSLSRTLTRLYCAVFVVRKPRTTWGLAARWLVAVISFFLAIALARVFRLIVQDLPFDDFWFVVGGVALLTVLWLLVPWLLLEGQVRLLHLLPGAAIAGLVWTLIGMAGDVALAPFLARSAAQYGVMGVAFTYLSWLYALSLGLVVAVTLGHELLPRRIRVQMAAAPVAAVAASVGGVPAARDLGRESAGEGHQPT